MIAVRHALPCSFLALMLSACATSTGDYPSLEIRAAERQTGSFASPADTGPPPALLPAPEAIEQRLARIMADARSAHGDFVASLPDAERRVSAGAGSGVASDAWSRAQVALADLDSARSRAAIALADLDLLYTETTLAGQERGAIAATRDEVTALIGQEDAALDRLRSRMGG